MFEAVFQYTFMQNAVLSAILASIACGIIGTVIVEKNLVMMSGGIAHTSFGGIGLGYYAGFEPLIGALVFSVFSAFGISVLKEKSSIHPDVTLGMFWSLGMAMGILFIAFAPGYPPALTSYLFGDILTVSHSDLLITGIMDFVIILTITFYFNAFKTYIFDEEFAQVIGLPVQFLQYATYILIALTVVVLIRVVGIILIIALLTAPPSIARQFTNNFRNIMLLSIILGIVFCLCGLGISIQMGIPSGASIIVISVISFFLVSYFKHKQIQRHN